MWDHSAGQTAGNVSLGDFNQEGISSCRLPPASTSICTARVLHRGTYRVSSEKHFFCPPKQAVLILEQDQTRIQSAKYQLALLLRTSTFTENIGVNFLKNERWAAEPCPVEQPTQQTTLPVWHGFGYSRMFNHFFTVLVFCRQLITGDSVKH